MKKILLLCCLALFHPVAFAVDISVGSTRLSIPTPSGFDPITSEMAPYAKLAQRFVPPSNEQFVLLLPSADAAIAAKGQIPESTRRFYVQTTKELIQPFVSAHDFAELKRMIKTQNEEILRKAEAQMPGLLQAVNQGISKDYELDLGLSMAQMLPLPPHYETERGLAYSMILKYNVNDENGKPSVFEGVVTATFVHLQGKVLFLYANAEKSGLEWSRMESQKWADMIIAANPSVGAIAVREASKRQSGFDWSKVLEKAVVGAIIGGLIGLLGYVFRKKKG